ncbi:MAG TPA: uracil-DNA glycosylase [Acidimicrobiales bacterium]|nr:uracil-DNA glycosylase [Acidimicrobiales bacterium]
MAPDGRTAPRDERRHLEHLAQEIVACRACPRLVAWREEVAAHPRAAFAHETYWARPLPGFGDPAARLAVVGLAPAAHGGNRTGRMFTGDRSGDFLFAALHRAGFASQPESRARDDGLVLKDAWVTAVVRCAPPANRPTPAERDACAPFLARELALLGEVRVVVALGSFALGALWRLPSLAAGPRPPFRHLLEAPLLPGPTGAGRTLICSLHPSQRNVFTGRLSAAMLDAVLDRARALLR